MKDCKLLMNRENVGPVCRRCRRVWAVLAVVTLVGVTGCTSSSGNTESQQSTIASPASMLPFTPSSPSFTTRVNTCHANTTSTCRDAIVKDLMAFYDWEYRARTDAMLTAGAERRLDVVFLGVVKAIGTAWSLVAEVDKQKADIQIGTDLVERLVHAVFGGDDDGGNVAADILEMERERNTLAEVIRLRLSQPPSAYSLGEALVDMRDYEAAGR